MAGPRLLPAVALALAALGGLKVIAIAQDAGANGEAVTPAPADPNTPVDLSPPADPAATPADGAAPGPNQCAPSFADQAGLTQDEVRVLTALGDRRRSLEGREGELDTREQVILAAEQRLEGRINELKGARDELQALLNRFDEEKAQKMQSLVNIYSNMKPKDAAEIFNGMESVLLTDVAEGMKDRALAEIMAQMDREKARRLTVDLAERMRIPDRVENIRPQATPGAAPAAAGR
jgi:flagellar motility protein MotE (MotC chaperone)